MLIRQLSVNSGMVWDKYVNALYRGKFRIGSLEEQKLDRPLPRATQKSPSTVGWAQQWGQGAGSVTPLLCPLLAAATLPGWNGWKSRGDGLLQRPWPGQGLRTCMQRFFHTQTGIQGHSCGTVCAGLSAWANYTPSWTLLVRIWPNAFYLRAGRFVRVRIK